MKSALVLTSPVLCCLLLAACATDVGEAERTGSSEQASTATAYVDFGSSAQTIEGFGGSTAWLPQLSSTQANALFGNSGTAQMGLSILRVRIDPGGQAHWGTEAQNAVAAKSRGARVIATPWTPPASMKSNGSTVGGSLNSGSYAAYASYLESFVNYMANSGASLYAMSLQNEPDANVTYESCSWTGAQMDAWVAGNGSAITTKLFVAEPEGFNTSLTDPTLNDSNAVGKIAFVGGHIYGASPSYYANAFSKGKEVWMTEHYVGVSGIGGAMTMAKEINDAMAVANYSAYLWWWVSDESSQGFSYGLIDANSNVKLDGFILGQWSKFVRPGYVRSNSTYSPQSNVYVTAFKGSGHYVIVAVNTATSAASQSFTIQNQTVTSLAAYQTSNAAQHMQQLSTVSVSGNNFTYTLPAQSVTTFVQ
jgi:glucuronoarabinoxylan endo-1,4-beta-xylanase